MQKRVLLLCVVIVLGLGAVFSLVGNPIDGNIWDHKFGRFSLFVKPSYWPSTFQAIHHKRGIRVDFGRVEYDSDAY